MNVDWIAIIFSAYSWGYPVLMLTIWILTHMKQQNPAIVEHFNDVHILNFSIMIPCLNEGLVIGRTIDSMMQFFEDHEDEDGNVKYGYPKNQVEFVVINDGSDDNTVGEVMKKMKKYPGIRVVIIDVPTKFAKKGKSGALNKGYTWLHHNSLFKDTNHQKWIIGVFDGDGYPDHDILQETTKYFMDPAIGGINSSIRIRNRPTGWYPRIQDIEFFLTTRLMNSFNGHLLGNAFLGGNGEFARVACLEDIHKEDKRIVNYVYDVHELMTVQYGQEMIIGSSDPPSCECDKNRHKRTVDTVSNTSSSYIGCKICQCSGCTDCCVDTIVISQRVQRYNDITIIVPVTKQPVRVFMPSRSGSRKKNIWSKSRRRKRKSTTSASPSSSSSSFSPTSFTSSTAASASMVSSSENTADFEKKRYELNYDGISTNKYHYSNINELDHDNNLTCCKNNSVVNSQYSYSDSDSDVDVDGTVFRVWSDWALTEDLDFGLKILLAGWKVDHMMNTFVNQQGLASYMKLLRQRTRWSWGTQKSFLKYFFPILFSMKIPFVTKIDLLFRMSNPFIVIFLVPFSLFLMIVCILGFVVLEMEIIPMWLILVTAVAWLYLLTYGLCTEKEYRNWKIPLHIISYVIYIIILSPVTYLAFLKVITCRKAKWTKTDRYEEDDSDKSSSGSSKYDGYYSSVA